MLGVIFRKAQNKIQDPAKLRRLIVDLIDKEQWSSLSADVKGDAYEGLLQKNAEDVKGGAGQYFTPRPLIAAMVDVVAPQPGQTICDPACGTGGFLLAAHDYLAKHQALDRAQKKKLKSGTFFGIELVDSVTRLCAMNLLLHGIGKRRPAAELCKPRRVSRGANRKRTFCPSSPRMRWPGSTANTRSSWPIRRSARRAASPSSTRRASRPRNRSSSTATISGPAPATNSSTSSSTSSPSSSSTAARPWFCPTTSCSKAGPAKPSAANCSSRPTCTPCCACPPASSTRKGVKANVLFFDRKPAQEKPWTRKLWIYDLRTNLHFTLKENTLKRSDLDDFVACYNHERPHDRKESERFKAFTYDDLIKRDKVNLDIFWLKDEALEESANLPAPEIIAQEITDDLEAALEQFATIAEDLRVGGRRGGL
jgi:type I restriction enzyme M protein